MKTILILITLFLVSCSEPEKNNYSDEPINNIIADTEYINCQVFETNLVHGVYRFYNNNLSTVSNIKSLINHYTIIADQDLESKNEYMSQAAFLDNALKNFTIKFNQECGHLW